MGTNQPKTIPQGYKATALGIIPQEWEVKRIKDFGPVITGSTPSTLDSENYGGRYMFVSPADLSEDAKYIMTTEKTLSDKGYSQARRIPKGSILFTCIGSTIGKIGIASQDLATNQQINSIVTNGEYLFYALSFQSNRIKILANEQAVPIINKSDFERIKVAFPPLAEQRKIAEVLGVWDEAIEKQARLIEKLALRKRGLMQRLLSAKLRLPGFSEPWEKVKLGDIGHFLSSNTLSRDCLNEQIGNIKNIHYGDILIKLPTIVDASFIHIPYVNDDVIVKSDYLKNGDIIFADTAEDYTVGKAIEIINIQAIPVTSGLHTIPFRPKSGIFVNRFLGYYVNSTDYRRQLQPLIQGIKVYSISKTALCKTTLKIPTLSEQTAIAEVLTAADREIDLAKEKLERLRRQKRGLMQQLLTGKKRIAYF